MQALAPSTRKLYNVGHEHYYGFCRLHRCNPLPASELQLAGFITYLADVIKAAPATIKVYMAAVRSLHLERGHGDPFDGTTLPHRVFTGVKRTVGTHARLHRLPITLPLLRGIVTSLKTDETLQPIDRLMVATASTLAFLVSCAAVSCWHWAETRSASRTTQCPTSSSPLQNPKPTHSGKAARSTLDLQIPPMRRFVLSDSSKHMWRLRKHARRMAPCSCGRAETPSTRKTLSRSPNERWPRTVSPTPEPTWDTAFEVELQPAPLPPASQTGWSRPWDGGPRLRTKPTSGRQRERWHTSLVLCWQRTCPVNRDSRMYISHYLPQTLLLWHFSCDTSNLLHSHLYLSTLCDH